jgi:hypothetical protein
MFRTGDKTDFERMLDDLLARHRMTAATATLEVESQFAASAGQSSRLPLAIELRITPIHESALADAMRLLVQFSERTGIAVTELCGVARPKLASFTNQVLERMVLAANRMRLTQAIAEFRERFNRRVEHALRDVEIGFVQGNSAIMTESQKSQSKAMRLLKGIYDHTRDGSEPILVTELLSETCLTADEAKAGWRYLKDGGLIDTFSIPFRARINGAGIEVIENAQRHPDQPSPSFPSVTYNIVNNTMNVGTALNSPLQQAGPASALTQTIAYSSQELADLSRLVVEFERHINELEIDPQQKQRAEAQIATLKAQLTDEPDPVIVKQAGRTLRNITEGAIGSLVAAAAQPTVWSWVTAAMEKLFG